MCGERLKSRRNGSANSGPESTTVGVPNATKQFANFSPTRCDTFGQECTRSPEKDLDNGSAKEPRVIAAPDTRGELARIVSSTSLRSPVTTNSRERPTPLPGRRRRASGCLLMNFEESALNGRLPPTGDAIDGFRLKICQLGELAKLA